ncbi:hypothetical protein NQZ68_013898 [Dissostichus eleginoides]|nr:hypothetical protein NQZ68_013898 [Dissostichus eleginoides]
MLPLADMNTVDKSQLNNWHLLKVAEVVPWRRRLSRTLNVLILRVMRQTTWLSWINISSLTGDDASQLSNSHLLFLLSSPLPSMSFLHISLSLPQPCGCWLFRFLSALHIL